MEYLVVGGGPAGLIEAQRLSAIGKEVTLVSPQWGGIMECMGEHYLQSYFNELELPGSKFSLRYFMKKNELSPRACEYISYLRRYAKQLEVTKVTDVLLSAEFDGEFYSCNFKERGKAALKVKKIIAATGIKPKAVEKNKLYNCKKIRCIEAYEHFSNISGSCEREQSVVIIGSGNSAFQIARLAAASGYNTHIMAKKYNGIYPIETVDRFALRSCSQITIEKIWKSQTNHENPEISFSVYRDFYEDENELSFKIHARDNYCHIAKATIENLSTPSSFFDEYTRTFRKDSIIIVLAIGMEPAQSFSIEGGAHYQGSYDNIYWAGSVANYQSVNTMISPRC